MSEIHAAAMQQNVPVLSRLTELLALLETNLPDAEYQRARDLLRATFSPEFSRALHRADAPPPPPPAEETQPAAPIAAPDPPEAQQNHRRRRNAATGRETTAS